MSRGHVAIHNFVRTTISLPPELHEYLMEECRVTGRPLTTQIHWMLEFLRAYLEAHPNVHLTGPVRTRPAAQLPEMRDA